MPFIEEAKAEPDKESLALRIESETKRELEGYAQWLKYDSVSECACKILRAAFKLDDAWQQHLKLHPESIQRAKRRARREEKQSLKVAS